MAGPESTLRQPSRPGKDKKYFTLAEACRALPLVRRIAADIQNVQAERRRLQSLAAPGGVKLPQEQLLAVQQQFDRQTTDLENYLDELHMVGVELKDEQAAQLYDFPAIHEGREVYLCWKTGEPTISHWHEVHTGFAGRRSVSELSDRR